MNSAPRTLIVELTQRCNHACLHCYNVWQGERAETPTRYPRGELEGPRTLDLLARALDETGCRHITLTGGEPLLRADLLQIADFLSGRGVRITLISNGRLLTEPVAAALIDHGVGTFELPLLSHRREVHDRLSAAPGAWDAVLSAMASIRLHHGQVVAAFVGTRINIGDLDQTMRLAFAFGARALMFNRFNPGGRGRLHMSELLPSVEQVRQALAAAEAAAVALGMPIACSIPVQPCLIDTRAYPHVGFGACALGTERAYYTLDPLGNLRPCNHSPLILGNLLETPFRELVAGDAMRRLMGALPTACDTCAERATCQGGCKAAAQACYGAAGESEPFLRLARQSADRHGLATSMHP